MAACACVEGAPSSCESEAEDNDSRSSEECGGGDNGERNHFYEVCYSCLAYRDGARKEVDGFLKDYAALDAGDAEIWLGTSPADHTRWCTGLRAAVEVNGRFLEMLPTPEVCGSWMDKDQCEAVWNMPPNYKAASRNVSKVRTTLRQFVRDWSAEGQAERDVAYAPLVDAIQRHLSAPAPGTGGRKPRVLCPGSGLGRLPFDLARAGYAAQGNEFSYHMLLGSHLMYNRTSTALDYTIYPYALGRASRASRGDNLRPVKVPDVCPCEALPEDAEISMAAGEFVGIYEDQVGEWDGLATSFFLDTAKNVFLYIRTFAAILRPGGLWTNLGPLLYHFAESSGSMSVELSWAEVRPAIERYFDFVEEDVKDATYTFNPKALQRTLYRCVFFVARRNSVPVSGKSNPVY